MMTPANDDTWDPAASVGTTATMAAAARAIATTDGVINDVFAEPLVRAVGVNFLTRWATGELAASDLDAEGSPWGLAQMPASIAARTRYFDEFCGYLAPEAQDRLLDAVTALSARGSRLGSEAVPNTADMDPDAARERMREATAKWRQHGFELDFDMIGFEGERHDVGAYLDARGWMSVATPTAELLAGHGLGAIPRADDDRQTMNGVTYYTSTLGVGR